MARKSFEELNQLKEQFNTDILWSWSRINCTHNSLYEYYLKYVAKKKPDRENSIYTCTGGISHDIIEKFYLGELPYDKMLEEFEDGWETAMMADLKFDRNDEEKNKSVGDKYYYNLKHFFTHHVSIETKLLTEQFVTVKIGDEYLQGYIDALTKDENGNYHILDWKTSSIYLGEKAKNECGQLVIYAIALNQKGIPFDKIKIAWDFLKYTNVYIDPQKVNLIFTTCKGEEKVKEKLDNNKICSTIKATVKAWMKQLGYDKTKIDEVAAELDNNNLDAVPSDVMEHYHIEKLKATDPRRIERCKIGEDLQSNVKSQMKKLGYNEDEIFEALDLLVQTNDIASLPEDVQSCYRFDDCFVYVDLTEELINHWTTYVIDTIKMIREKETEYNANHDDSIWMEDQETVKAQSFYFANLCSYSANLHKPYKLYLETLEREKNGGLLGNSASNEFAEDDLSWLEEL